MAGRKGTVVHGAQDFTEPAAEDMLANSNETGEYKPPTTEIEVIPQDMVETKEKLHEYEAL